MDCIECEIAVGGGLLPTSKGLAHRHQTSRSASPQGSSLFLTAARGNAMQAMQLLLLARVKQLKHGKEDPVASLHVN